VAQNAAADIDVLHDLVIGIDASGFGNRFAVFQHALEVKDQRLFHVGMDFLDRFAHRGAARDVETMSAVYSTR